VRARLGSLPEGLTATYDEIYTKIQCQKGSKPTVARRALQWIFSSHVPLKVDIILAAVCQSVNDTEPQEVDVTVDFVLSSCQNLLVLGLRYILRLSHLSVREYFEENHQDLIIDGISLTAYVCLRVLIHPNTRKISALASTQHESSEVESSQSPATAPLTPLIDYARYLWPNHCRAMENTDDPTFLALEMEFIGSREETGPAYKEWYHSIEYGQGYFAIGAWTGYIHDLLPVHLALLPICFFGLEKALEEVSSKSVINANLTNKDGAPVLYLAAGQGHWRIAKSLLDRGANANALGRRYGSVLAAAAEGGNESVIRLLLERGADINARLEGIYISALATAAARWDGESIVKLLLEHGADVNMIGGVDGSVLATAVFSGNESIIRMLLEYGADINAQFFGDWGNYGSALAAAA
jgi:hypothetical protein